MMDLMDPLCEVDEMKVCVGRERERRSWEGVVRIVIWACNICGAVSMV